MHSGPCAHGKCTQVHLCATTNYRPAHLHHCSHNYIHVLIHIHIPTHTSALPKMAAFFEPVISWLLTGRLLTQEPRSWGSQLPKSGGLGLSTSFKMRLKCDRRGETRECRRTCMTTAQTCGFVALTPTSSDSFSGKPLFLVRLAGRRQVHSISIHSTCKSQSALEW